jgi:hypothetical protein
VKKWVEKWEDSDNGMAWFKSCAYLDYETRHKNQPLASYGYSNMVHDQGMVSVTLYTADNIPHYRRLKATPEEAAAICEAHLKLNLGYAENGAPGRAIWKPNYTGD